MSDEGTGRGLPTGTVTFLRTDVEGSMGLARSLGRAWDGVNSAHLATIASAVERHGGVVVRTEGDALFGAFGEAGAGASAASDAQRALHEGDWGVPGGLRVRMGLHSGEAHRAGDDYGGFDVSRAARIAAAGHGGQIVVSGATAALIADQLPPGTRLDDLGTHHLRDVPRPERLYQLSIEGLPSEFAPPRTAGAVVGNLPDRLTSFLGRDAELAAVAELASSARLITLTGNGWHRQDESRHRGRAAARTRASGRGVVRGPRRRDRPGRGAGGDRPRHRPVRRAGALRGRRPPAVRDHALDGHRPRQRRAGARGRGARHGDRAGVAGHAGHRHEPSAAPCRRRARGRGPSTRRRRRRAVHRAGPGGPSGLAAQRRRPHRRGDLRAAGRPASGYRARCRAHRAAAAERHPRSPRRPPALARTRRPGCPEPAAHARLDGRLEPRPPGPGTPAPPPRARRLRGRIRPGAGRCDQRGCRWRQPTGSTTCSSSPIAA